LRATSGVWDQDYFPADEHDRIEHLFFRYLICRSSLWDMVRSYLDYRERFPDATTQTKAFVIGFDAALHLAFYASLLVDTFVDEEMGVAKLNEAYPRSGIPADTFDEIFRSVTSPRNTGALEAAWLLFRRETDDETSTLRQVAAADPRYAERVREARVLHARARDNLSSILRKKSFLLPRTTNYVRHTAVSYAARRVGEIFGSNLYAARAILFRSVGDIKVPLVEPIELSREQIQRVLSSLRPGDVILTFTAGYMSNIFLPGEFKHGIVFVGSPEQRRRAGLVPDRLVALPESERMRIAGHIDRATLPSGQDADVVESVAEGVIFNSLEHLMRTHINRMAVLRPRLSDEERVEALTTVFRLVGNRYDFRFDFNDASAQCCTELIYRALHGRGSIRFSLVERMGLQTLSADDVDANQLDRAGDFDFVLLAEENPAAPGHASVETGRSGEARLRALLGRERGGRED